MEANYTALTGFIRNTLIKPPLEEEAIPPGMGLMYASAFPAGGIDVHLKPVKSNSPMEGCYDLMLNQRLEVRAAMASTSIFMNARKSIKGDDYFHVKYGDRIFKFQFNNYYSDTIENAEHIHDSRDSGSGFGMITRGILNGLG